MERKRGYGEYLGSTTSNGVSNAIPLTPATVTLEPRHRYVTFCSGDVNIASSAHWYRVYAAIYDTATGGFDFIQDRYISHYTIRSTTEYNPVFDFFITDFVDVYFIAADTPCTLAMSIQSVSS